MKKYTSIIGMAAVIGVFALAMPAMAATNASLSPASVSVTAGKSFSVVITANPQGVMNYAEKLEVDYPASNLEVTSFTLGNNWMALTQSGYDSIDNTNGTLIKTAGYPAGFSGATTFGTITFYAKKVGTGTIKIGNSSLAFEANSQSTITGSGTAFAVSAKAVAPAKTTEEQVAPAVETTPVVQEATNTTPVAIQTAPNTQTAAVAEAGSPSYTWLWILLIIVVLGAIGWWIYSRRTSTRV
jgi:hypothetical protein